MVDAWINCQNCGNRYGSWTSACPKCRSSNSGYNRKSHGTKRLKKIVLYSLAGFGAVIGILLIIGLALISNDNTISNGSNNVAASDNKIDLSNHATETIEEKQSIRQINLQMIEIYEKCVTDAYDGFSPQAKADCNESMNMIAENCAKFNYQSCDQDKIAQFKEISSNPDRPVKSGIGMSADQYIAPWPHDYFVQKVYPSNMICGITYPRNVQSENGTTITTTQLFQLEDFTCQINVDKNVKYWDLNNLPPEIYKVHRAPYWEHQEGIRELQDGRVMRYLSVTFDDMGDPRNYDGTLQLLKLNNAAVYAGQAVDGTLTITIEKIPPFPCDTDCDTETIYQTMKEVKASDFQAYYNPESYYYDFKVAKSDVKPTGQDVIVTFKLDTLDEKTFVYKTSNFGL